MKDYHAEAMDALLEHGRLPRADGRSLTSFIADAIKKAVDEEREACAKMADAEPELPGPIPERSFEEAMRVGLETFARVTVKITKDSIAKAIRERAK